MKTIIYSGNTETFLCLLQGTKSILSFDLQIMYTTIYLHGMNNKVNLLHRVTQVINVTNVRATLHADTIISIS